MLPRAGSGWPSTVSHGAIRMGTFIHQFDSMASVSHDCKLVAWCGVAKYSLGLEKYWMDVLLINGMLELL